MKKRHKILLKLLFLGVGVSIIYSVFILLIAKYISIYVALFAVALDYKLEERQKHVKKWL